VREMGVIEWLGRFRRPAAEPEYMDDELFEALFEEDGAETGDESAGLLGGGGGGGDDDETVLKSG
jgi:hypothetical protein